MQVCDEAAPTIRLRRSPAAKKAADGSESLRCDKTCFGSDHRRQGQIAFDGKGAAPVVSVVDDDDSLRESLPGLLRELGYNAEAFSSGEEFLARGNIDHTRCLILDVSMPGMSGPDLRRELERRGRPVPIVFMTALCDETLRSRLMAEGAEDCLFKPFSEAALLRAVSSALRGP